MIGSDGGSCINTGPICLCIGANTSKKRSSGSSGSFSFLNRVMYRFILGQNKKLFGTFSIHPFMVMGLVNDKNSC